MIHLLVSRGALAVANSLINENRERFNMLLCCSLPALAIRCLYSLLPQHAKTLVLCPTTGLKRQQNLGNLDLILIPNSLNFFREIVRTNESL